MYIIAGCNTKNGTIGDDSARGEEYFELGWELVLTRLCVVSGLKSKLFDPEKDTIVTINTRQFLYSGLFKNVISYQEFLTLNVDKNQVYDLTLDVGNWVVYNKLDTTANKLWTSQKDFINSNYLYTLKDTPEIGKFNLIDTKNILKDNNDFCCMVVRKRDHVPGRGLSDQQLIDCFNRLYDKKYTTYIMGKSAESYENKEKNIYHISLQEMTSLINDPNCKGLITPLSGGGMIRFFTGVCPMITFDMTGHYSDTHPLMWGNPINFTGLSSSNWKLVRGYEPNILNFI